MTWNRPKATWLLSCLLAWTWTGPLIPRVLEKTLPASARPVAFLVAAPTAIQLPRQLKAYFRTVRISNQRNEPLVTPAPYANCSLYETSKQTTSCLNNSRENTQRKRSICYRSKWFLSGQVQSSSPWFPGHGRRGTAHTSVPPLRAPTLCIFAKMRDCITDKHNHPYIINCATCTAEE